MKKLIGILISFLMMSGATAVFSADGTKQPALKVTDMNKAVYEATTFPGVSKSTIYTNSSTGAYAAYTKFAGGTQIALHSHSSNRVFIIISGVLLVGDGKSVQRVTAGGHIYISAGYKHTIGAETESIVFEQSPGAFDIKMAK